MNNQRPRINDDSPWGEIQRIQKIDNGIYWIDTPGHGGVWLSPKHIKELPKDYKPFTRDSQWAEEDIDAAVVLKALGYDPVTLFKIDGDPNYTFEIGTAVTVFAYKEPFTGIVKDISEQETHSIGIEHQYPFGEKTTEYFHISHVTTNPSLATHNGLKKTLMQPLSSKHSDTTQ